MRRVVLCCAVLWCATEQGGADIDDVTCVNIAGGKGGLQHA